MQGLDNNESTAGADKSARAGQLRTLRLEAIEQLATASDLVQCASGVVAAVCRNLQWDCGLYWTAIPAGAALECIATYDNAATAAFVASSCSLRFRHGEGLPGQVSASREPAWIVDVATAPDFPRASAAIAAGLHSAFACPVVAGDVVLGVLEFFTRQPHEPDADLIETMSTVTGAFAQFIERWSAEEKLKRSERDLTDFFENANIGLHWVAGDGTILRANRAELDLLGYSADEYIGHHIAEFHADAPVIGDILRRLTDGEKLRDYPARMRCKDGSLRDVLIHSSVLWDEGRFVHTRCFTRDVTAEKHAAQALGQSESRFRALMEQAPASIQILAPDGTTVDVNRAWRELWGLTLDHVAGYNVLTDPQLEAKGVAPLLRKAFAGEAVRIPAIAYNPNETLRKPSRHDDPVRWIAAVAYPLKDESGAIREVVLVHEDITARKRAEEALRESEEKLRLLADTIPQLAWMAQADGETTWLNRRWYEYTGTAPEESHGSGWQSVQDPAALPEILERWKHSIATGERFDMVLNVRGRDGQFRPFLTRINPLRGADGRILHWFGTGTDISELKRMEDALRDADRRKDEFLATLAHELRNPLAPISNSLQILKMPHVDANTSRLTRQVMERQVQHLVRLVDDLLDVSRVMRGRIELRREHVELSAVIARAVETAQPLLDAKSHRLNVAIADDSMAVRVDPVRLTQVFGNLLTNAARYTDDGGEISLAARREGNDAVVEIRDNGVGIAPAMLPLIFELFVQADPAGPHSHGGLGIGLTLARNLVQMHGGTLSATSAGIGSGATFTVHLPLASSAPPQLARSEAPATSGKKQLRLLVVDDNKDAATTLATLLQLRGHEVLVAHDGKTAIAVASTYRPELIFLDLGMPGMDGYEVARTIKNTPELRDTCIAALTGWGQPEDRRRAREAGCDHHLVKPPDAEAVDGLLGLFS